MTKTAFDLYRCEATEWADLTWTEALRFRVDKALKAKLYYRRKAKEVLHVDDVVYKQWLQKYTDSEDAVEWNREWLEEVE